MSPPATKSPYAGHRFPAEVIGQAVWLYFRFPLSLRMVEEMLAARGIVVSHETVRQWALKFGQDFANRIRRRLPCAGDKWHLDEVAIRIAGVQHWLWRAVDQIGMVLDVLVQSRRDKRAAKRLLRKLLKRQCRAPRVMITDKLGSYGAAKKELMPGVEHRRHKGLNNRAENLYGAFCVKRSLLSSPDRVLRRRIGRSLACGRRSEGSPPRTRRIAPRTCIRSVRADLNHDAAMRIGGEAPERRTQSHTRRRSHSSRRAAATSDHDRQPATPRRAPKLFPSAYPTAVTAGRRAIPVGGSPVVANRHKASRSFLANATMSVLRVPPRASAVRARYHCARALCFWKVRKRQASWTMPRRTMPRRTRAFPAFAKPFSRRLVPLSSGAPVSPA